VSPPYTILRPDNRYASRLPNLRDALLYKLVTPRHAPARLGQYLVALEPGGGTSEPVPPGFEDFLYVLAGELPVVRANGIDFSLRPGGWCYLPPDMSFELEAGGDGPAEVLWIKRRLEPWPASVRPRRARAIATTSRSRTPRCRGCAAASCSTRRTRGTTST
jgi:(S)-ureidoglycine aminohydrolase